MIIVQWLLLVHKNNRLAHFTRQFYYALCHFGRDDKLTYFFKFFTFKCVR